MRGRRFNLDECLAKARIAIQDGRTDEGIDELRRAILDSAHPGRKDGKRCVETILRFAHDHEIFEEVEETLHDEPLRQSIFGPE